MSSETSHPFDDSDAEFERAIVDLEQSALGLKQRYTQIKQDLQRQAQLEAHFNQVEQEWRTRQLPEFEAELFDIRDRLRELSLALESALLSSQDFQRLFWKGLRQGLLGEVFWQIVRFGGLGIVIGWLLKSWAG